MKQIAVLGSTGSVGVQTLDVIESGKWSYDTVLLSCNTNIALFREQVDRFRPEAVAVGNTDDAAMLRREFPGMSVYEGPDGLVNAIEETKFEIAVNAIVGIAGLKPTLALIKKGGVKIALANKETLVTGGRIVMAAVKKAGVTFLPVDSEHSAILQCLRGNEKNRINRIVLTASGGPFRGYSRERLETVTVEETLAHPNWSMGSKITVDSATMINKVFEVIEAKWLYSVPYDKIDVVIHPQSIVHSFVEYDDGSVIAQLSSPDMRIPISYAITYPARRNCDARRLNFADMKELTFEEPSAEARRALNLAVNVLRENAETAKDSGAIVLNAANELLVDMFLKGEIRFVDIVDTLERVLSAHNPRRALDIEDIMEIDSDARKITGSLIKGV